MSKVTELQIAQVGYESGKMAIENMKPKVLTVDIIYKKENTEINPGKISYDPDSDLLIITGIQPDIMHEARISFTPEAIPALIKTLKELTE
ncbi:hypothetical protein AGMMS50268_04070 [Spirochaetia bacterium]|nr:hypothetical protein AGMMS50268_04070 [Spirochaetia bacterium]